MIRSLISPEERANAASVYSRPFSAIINKSDLSKISKLYNIPDHLTAPLKSAEAVGEIIFEIGGKRVGKSELFVKDSIDKIGVWGLFGQILSNAVLGESKNRE